MQKSTETPIDRAAIAARAYELYCARGRQPGHDLDDWLRAEAELLRASDVERAVEKISQLPPPAGMEPIRLKRRRTPSKKA